jgi:hypothetical protein
VMLQAHVFFARRASGALRHKVHHGKDGDKPCSR